MTNTIRATLLLEFCKKEIQSPLSLWERVRVRVFRRKTSYLMCVIYPGPHPLPLSQRERGDIRKTSVITLIMMQVDKTSAPSRRSAIVQMILPDGPVRLRIPVL
jgi:hypothetical protein